VPEGTPGAEAGETPMISHGRQSMTATMADRLERFQSDGFTLRCGAGRGINGEIDVCAMQAVAWLAGEPNTDRPECACPVIGRYVIRLNDSRLFDGYRDTLKPYLPKIIGTRSTQAIERRRAFIAADFAVRSLAPTALRALKREEWAAQLEAAPQIVDRSTGCEALSVAREVRSAADAAIAAYAAAAADADAAAYAYAYAAAAAAAAAYADAYAYAYAYAAAYADAYAAAAAAAAVAVAAYAYAYADEAAAAAAAAAAYAALRAKSLECLDAMILVGAPE
jgi:hypothetical protein